MAIDFEGIGSFRGVKGESPVLNNPTSLQFGADGRLYVAEQNGSINAFTVEMQNGEYVAIAHEELRLANGTEVIRSIQNHNDDGSLSQIGDRQVTGIVTAGTAANPVLYVSSSDPRIAFSADSNLDTNSGIVTRLTWNGSAWEAVDLIRGLPRSEQNHSVNGMVLSEDGTKLYLAVGGNTNNGAPSSFFAHTGEYALSGTVLEIDLEDLGRRLILTDLFGGQNFTPRQYIYDLPTLDDPNTVNNDDGVGEDSNGLDETAPWGGNDGLNMAILPADAPFRIFADGLRNNFDLVLTSAGLFTIDNGSNTSLGGNPLDANGNPTEELGAGKGTNAINNAGVGDPEPLFYLEDGGYYGHPAPVRAEQNLAWTVYDDQGNPDQSLGVNQVDSLTDLVPAGIEIAQGWLIAPSQFSGDRDRLAQSGIRIEHNSPDGNSLVNLGSSSNGLTSYRGEAFGGALQGSLITAQFNGNVTLVNLNDEGTAVEPLTDPTAEDALIDDDGIFPLITGQSLPLDVIEGPNGTLWVTELGTGQIDVFAPTNSAEIVAAVDQDIDQDGILNVDDPFIRDRTNGNSVIVVPEQTLVWDFDANQDNNLPGINGYGGGLTGVMIDGATDFEDFFQQSSSRADQVINLDNVKFNTAAGGGSIVIESVSDGDAYLEQNDGAYLFHTGVTLAPTVETFRVKWSIFNPVSNFTGSFQQIGGYIGTGDQRNYLKIVAIAGLDEQIQILLEDDDLVVAESLIATDDLSVLPPNHEIFLELEIDPVAATAMPTVSYAINQEVTTFRGTAIDLSSTAVLSAIQGDYAVNGQETGLAVGLFSSNTGQPSSFQAAFNDVEITATGDTAASGEVEIATLEDTIATDRAMVLYRVNAGGVQIAALDNNIPWSADTIADNNFYLSNSGSNTVAAFPNVLPGGSLTDIPQEIFASERWDLPEDPAMAWAFDIPQAGLYEVRLYIGNGFAAADEVGERIFDVAVEGNVPIEFAEIDPVGQFGHEIGGVISTTTEVRDGTLNLEFIHGRENPLVNGIEIWQIAHDNPPISVSLAEAELTTEEDRGQVQISLLADSVVPSNETLYATLEILPDSAIAKLDYEYQSDTASFDESTGIYTDRLAIAGSSFDATLTVDLIADNMIEEPEMFTVRLVDLSSQGLVGESSSQVTIEDSSFIGDIILERSGSADIPAAREFM